MDELERKRQRRDEKSAEAHAAESSPLDDLTERYKDAEADDRAAAERDRDARGADQEAATRDRAAEGRDAEAESRDDAAAALRYPLSPFAERRKARGDREDSADDRVLAAEDRDRARGNREAAARSRGRAGDDRGAVAIAVAYLRELLAQAEDQAEHTATIGQAQGMIMAARDCSPLEALLELTTRAVRDKSEIEAAAREIVRESKE